jgi:hypothetical protein
MDANKALKILWIKETEINSQIVKTAYKKSLQSLHPDSQNFQWWETQDTAKIRQAQKILIWLISSKADWILKTSQLPKKQSINQSDVSEIRNYFDDLMNNINQEESEKKFLREQSELYFVNKFQEILIEWNYDEILKIYNLWKYISIEKDNSGWIDLNQEKEKKFLQERVLFLAKHPKKIYELITIWWYAERLAEMYAKRFEEWHYSWDIWEVVENFSTYIWDYTFYDVSILLEIVENNPYIQKFFPHFTSSIKKFFLKIENKIPIKNNQHDFDFS